MIMEIGGGRRQPKEKMSKEREIKRNRINYEVESVK